MLAVEAAGKRLTTIEGLKDSIMQEKFIQNWAIQCGYCTPGFIMNCYGLLMNNPEADDSDVDEWLDSNICRCTGYQEIKDAMKQALLKRKTFSSSADDDKVI